MLKYRYYIMKEGIKIIANKGYGGDVYLSLVSSRDRKPIIGNLGKISSAGVPIPVYLKALCKILEYCGVIVEPLAQATLELTRKPVDNLI